MSCTKTSKGGFSVGVKRKIFEWLSVIGLNKYFLCSNYISFNMLIFMFGFLLKIWRHIDCG